MNIWIWSFCCGIIIHHILCVWYQIIESYVEIGFSLFVHENLIVVQDPKVGFGRILYCNILRVLQQFDHIGYILNLDFSKLLLPSLINCCINSFHRCIVKSVFYNLFFLIIFLLDCLVYLEKFLVKCGVKLGFDYCCFFVIDSVFKLA